ncbi:hypothetical protein ACFCWD_21070 [Streptomyces sp. NPDC056374]|uniref:hypothetical protein n=1 Tax=unclassified Streptomyces TaxID=2593676 RepID=UPI0035D868FE
MTHEARTLVRVTGVLAVVVATAVGIGLYNILRVPDYMVPIDTADVEGTWIAEEDGSARLVIRGDGTAELTPEAEATVCGWPTGRKTRVIRAAWTFGDADDPRLMHMELDAAYPCSFGFGVEPDGQVGIVGGGDRPYTRYIRSETPD